MGKSTSFNDATKSEFSRMEQLLIQTANDAAQCLKVLKSNLAEYDKRHGLLFLNTAKSFVRADIRAAKDLASELHHVADQIAKSDPPSETEIAAARDKVNAVSDAMINLKKRARSYDRKNSLERASEVSSISDLSLTESEGSFVGEGKSSEVPSAADTVEAVVRLTLRHNFRGFAAVKHQIRLAEESLSPSFAERVMDTVVSMTNSLKGEAEFDPETKPKKSMSV